MTDRSKMLTVAVAVAGLLSAGAATSDLSRLRARLVELAGQERAGVARAQTAAARLAALNAAEAELKARVGANQQSLTRLLGALETYRRDPPPALLVSPRSASDAVRAAILMKTIAPELQRRATALAAEGRQLNGIRRQILIEDGDLLGAEHDVADRRAQIEALAEDRARIEGPQDPIMADAARRAAASGSVGDAVAAVAPSDPASGKPPDHLVAPVAGPVVRRFGDAFPGHGRSEGWSWRVPDGSLVVSPADGRVLYAGPLKGWGVVVILQTGGGYHLVLAGLERPGVKVGADVAAGEPVARLARSTGGPGAGSELYLELRRGARPVDPSPLFGARGR